MSFNVLLIVIPIVIALVPFIGLQVFIFRSKGSIILKIITSILVMFVSLIIWFVALQALYTPLVNKLSESDNAPCFTLNKMNCEKRPDCRSSFSIGGLGNDSFYCANN